MALPEPTMSNQVKGPPLFQQDVDLDMDALDMEPGLQLRPKITSLDEKTALAMAQASMLGQITVRLGPPGPGTIWVIKERDLYVVKCKVVL